VANRTACDQRQVNCHLLNANTTGSPYLWQACQPAPCAPWLTAPLLGYARPIVHNSVPDKSSTRGSCFRGSCFQTSGMRLTSNVACCNVRVQHGVLVDAQLHPPPQKDLVFPQAVCDNVLHTTVDMLSSGVRTSVGATSALGVIRTSVGAAIWGMHFISEHASRAWSYPYCSSQHVPLRIPVTGARAWSSDRSAAVLQSATRCRRQHGRLASR
jgi:hypothetical protein